MAPALLIWFAMIEPIFQSDNYLTARKLLDAAALRQQAIASNIANSETPGYRRLEVSSNFATELRSRLAEGKASATLGDLKPTLMQDPSARSMRPDGNSVDIERELLEMNRNTVDFEFLTEMVSRNIKQMKLAITGRGI